MVRSLALSILLLVAVPARAADCVVLLHGMARTAASMEKIAERFQARGYNVENVDYPSRKHTVEELAPMAIESGLAGCPADATVHFVTHSLGGILVRYYLEREDIANLGRVVMLAPPNQGSQVVDTFGNVPGFELLNGPAGMQLGTDEESVPTQLGPVEFELGVIAGTDTFNPILSQSLPNPDDGKVSVESTKVEGMTDFLVVSHSHPFIMRAPLVINQIVAFIENGQFDDEACDGCGDPAQGAQ